MPTVVITGSNRGLGLEFARQYAAAGWRTIASCRDPARAEALRSLPVEARPLDVSDPASIERFAANLAGEPVDVLINNAGAHDGPRAKDLDTMVDPDRWIQGFKVNVLGPVLLTKALRPCLRLAERPVALTLGSLAGCLNLYQSKGLHMYRATKAAAPAAAVCLANELADEGIVYFAVRPGHTKTDMTSPAAPYEPEDTVAKLRQVIANATSSYAGKFVDRTGEILPWLPEPDLGAQIRPF